MKVIIIKSVPDSFWRSGVKFSNAGTELDTEALSADQLQAIADERKLVVSDSAALAEIIAEKRAPKAAKAKA